MRKSNKEKQKNRSRTVTLELDIAVLAIDSNHEPVTKVGFEYREKHVYPYLEKQGLKVVRCQGSLAKRTYVEVEARKPTIRYVTGIGHGKPPTYTGDYYDKIFTVDGYHPEECKEKIIHLCSCETGRLLGPNFVVNGCTAYFGYDEPFSFQMDEADIFFECDSEIDLGFAENLPAEKVFERVIKVFNKRIDDFKRKGADYKAATLEFNRDHLRCPNSGAQWGSKTAKL